MKSTDNLELLIEGRWRESCRQMGCFAATLGPFCVSHAAEAEDRRLA